MLKVLMIVDIQAMFGNYFTWNYLTKVNDFLRRYEGVYTQRLGVLEVGYNKTVLGDICKGLRDEYGFISNYFELKCNYLCSDSVPDFIIRTLTQPMEYKIFDKAFWNDGVISGKVPDNLVFTPQLFYPDGPPYPFYESSCIKRLLVNLDEISSDVSIDLIGGGLTKCVEILHNYLVYRGYSVNILQDYCYDVRLVNSNRRDSNVFNTKMTVTAEKKLGQLCMQTQKLTSFL